MQNDLTATDPDLWRTKAVASALKAEKMLWGKHNESIQAWLFESGFALATLRGALLGWQVRNALRPAKSWGVDACDTVHLPEGITIPVIRDKTLQRIAIYRMGHGHDGEYHTVEGSAPVPLILPGTTRRLAIVSGELDALLLHQELKKEWTVAATGPIPPEPLAATAAEADEIRLLALTRDGQRLTPWIPHATQTHTLNTDSLVSMARAGTLTRTIASLFG